MSSTGDVELSDSEIQTQYKLEYLTTLNSTGSKRRLTGFSEQRFVALSVKGSICRHEEMPIGKALYTLIKEQAQKGNYKAAKELADILLPEEN